MDTDAERRRALADKILQLEPERQKRAGKLRDVAAKTLPYENKKPQQQGSVGRIPPYVKRKLQLHVNVAKQILQTFDDGKRRGSAHIASQTRM